MSARQSISNPSKLQNSPPNFRDHQEIFVWYIRLQKVLDEDSKYILQTTSKKSKKDLYKAFYLVYKVYKDPIKTRYSALDCLSISILLVKWVDMMLQLITQIMNAHFNPYISWWGAMRVLLALNADTPIIDDIVQCIVKRYAGAGHGIQSG